MRIFFILLTVTALVSCGKDGGGSGSGNKKDVAQEQEFSEGINDGLGWDGLEAVVQSPVMVTSSDITFRSSKASSVRGSRIECSLSITAGESYQYSVSGDTLFLQTPNGNYEYARINPGTGSDISGTWKWFGQVDDYTLIHKTLFVSNNKQTAILRTNCER